VFASGVSPPVFSSTGGLTVVTYLRCTDLAG
jgi:hypothetical protein